MDTTSLVIWAIVAVVVLLAIVFVVYLASARKSLARRNQRAEEAWAQLTASLSTRASLSGGLVDEVRGYATHEKSVFETVDHARDEVLAASSPSAAASAEGALTAAIAALLAVAEGYPQLQACQGFLSVQSELTAAEDRVQSARRAYNGAVRDANARLGSFPNSLFTASLGVAPRQYFELDATQAIAEPPRVQF